ncbi:hypothetical protein Csa_012948, partial [Cucumis sativus]
KRDEFLYLEQRRLSVPEYERKFTKLAKYALILIVDEGERCRCSINDLREEIRTSIVLILIRSDYAQLVDAALRVEKSLGLKRSSSDSCEKGEEGSQKNKKSVILML